MSLCILAGGKTVTLAVAAFTLSWTHSVEKTRWEEDWLVAPSGLRVVEARVKGSGAGMEPPDGSVLKDGWWVYRPKMAPVMSLALGSSGATASGWSLCAKRECLTLGGASGEPVRLAPCLDQ